jgi:hypothetical protein
MIGGSRVSLSAARIGASAAFRWRDRVKSARPPGMTPGKTTKRQQTAPRHSVF